MKPLILDLETSGLHSQDDFISCIGLYESEGIRQFACKQKEYEKEILEEFASFCQFLPIDTLFVTYNGIMFDIPFLLTRLAKHNLSISDSKISRHLDLFPFINGKDESGKQKKYMTKEDACRRYCNIYVPSTCASLWFARCYKYGMVTESIHAQMLQHNAVDITATMQLYEYLQPFPDFQDFLNSKKQPAEVVAHD